MKGTGLEEVIRSVECERVFEDERHRIGGRRDVVWSERVSGEERHRSGGGDTRCGVNGISGEERHRCGGGRLRSVQCERISGDEGMSE